MKANLNNYEFTKILPFFAVFLLWSIFIGNFALPTFIIMFVLKIFSVITWSWWLIFLPLYYFVPLLIIGFLLDVLYLCLKKGR